MYASIILASLYIVISMISNITSLRIISLFKFTMDAGTLFYPVTFTLRDMIHKKDGKKTAIFVIWFAAVINVVMFLSFYLVSKLPPDMSVGAQTDFGKVLNPSARIVIGSIVAMVVSETIDTKVYEFIKHKIKKMYWLRVLISNGISIPIDTTLMTLIAFYGIPGISNSVIIAMIVSNILIKIGITCISLFWIYFIKEDRD